MHPATFAAVTALGVCAALAAIAAPASAQALSPNQPEAIPAQQGLSPPPCPRIGPPGTIQPLRIQPRQVAKKNRMGCLSAEDAVYAPNGCPVRFCGAATPRLALPGRPAQAPTRQAPAP
ncbi:MAG: hypothetical protein ACKOZW_04155 [Cyanobium sp.]